MFLEMVELLVENVLDAVPVKVDAGEEIISICLTQTIVEGPTARLSC